ncbi:MAG: hypothetical protein V1702_03990 [Candidatus Woesearchaeota archaeon]
MKKKPFIAAISLLMLLLSFTPALAAVDPNGPWAKLLDFFNLNFLGGEGGNSDYYVGFMRLVIFLILFAVIDRVLKAIPASGGSFGSGGGLFSHGNTAAVVALCFAAISAVFIPGEILLTIGATYGTAVVWILLGGFIFGLLALYWTLHKTDEGKILSKSRRILAMFLLGTIIWAITFIKPKMNEYLESTAGTLGEAAGGTFGNIMDFVLYATIALIFWDAIHLFSGSGVGSTIGSGVSNTFKRLKAEDKDESEVEREVLAVRNISNAETNIDRQHRRIGTLVFSNVKNYEENLKEAHQFMLEVVALEQEAATLYNEMKAGNAPAGVRDRIEQIRKKYKDYVGRVSQKVAAAVNALNAEKKALIRDAQLFNVEKARDGQINGLLRRVWALTGKDGKMIAQHMNNTYINKKQEAALKEVHQMAAEIDRLIALRMRVDQNEFMRVQNLERDLQNELLQTEQLLARIKQVQAAGTFIREDHLVDIVKWLAQLQNFGNMEQYKIQGLSQQEMVELKGFDPKFRMLEAKMIALSYEERTLIKQEKNAEKKVEQQVGKDFGTQGKFPGF